MQLNSCSRKSRPRWASEVRVRSNGADGVIRVLTPPPGISHDACATLSVETFQTSWTTRGATSFERPQAWRCVHGVNLLHNFMNKATGPVHREVIALGHVRRRPRRGSAMVRSRDRWELQRTTSKLGEDVVPHTVALRAGSHSRHDRSGAVYAQMRVRTRATVPYRVATKAIEL